MAIKHNCKQKLRAATQLARLNIWKTGSRSLCDNDSRQDNWMSTLNLIGKQIWTAWRDIKTKKSKKEINASLGKESRSARRGLCMSDGELGLVTLLLQRFTGERCRKVQLPYRLIKNLLGRDLRLRGP
ncbi:hypothetical protein Zmor_002316 [Zophobas morio]|uniref:Uncharacterized protein n=1 Tax=Zophobas morio TaxID=2755281 RepID=A0AA38MTQ0_9CUCU|nr:hypothetical protein Zmor_002316 [Zophobas morio]